MKGAGVTMVRIYLTEGDDSRDGGGRAPPGASAGKLLPMLLKRLHDQEKVRGVTVFRGISGFGRTGVVHSSRLLDLSMDLPVVVEFFDEPVKVERILTHLADLLPPGHVVSWPASVNE